MQLSSEDTIIIALCLCGMLMAFICLLSIWTYYFIAEKSWTTIEICSSIAILMFGCTCFGMLQQRRKGETIIIDAIWSMSWRIGSVFVYILFIKRLQSTFRNTAYATRNIYFVIFYVGCILFILANTFGYVIYALEDKGKISPQFLLSTWTAIIAIEQVIDLCLSISSISLFVHKLWLMNIDIVKEENNPLDNDLNQKQVKIIKAVSKITVLSSVAIISSQLFLISEAIISIYDRQKGYSWETSALPTRISRLYLPIDCIINIVCIELSFDFANKPYHRLCCCLDFICNAIATRKAKGQMNELKTSLMSMNNMKL
eukprot:325743_1